jgi:hypothetical protein
MSPKRLKWNLDPMKCMGGCTSIDKLKRCEGYAEAKAGSVCAATHIFTRCIKNDCAANIRERYPDSIPLPVMSHDNSLPLALAMQLLMPLCLNVWVTRKEKRRNMNAMERILYRPTFQGSIRPNKSYILIDDVVTQGGTIMALRQHVLNAGGRVDAVAAIAYAKYAKPIIPTQENIDKLFLRFGNELFDLFREFGLSLETTVLSNSQIRYLLQFSSVANMRRMAMGNIFENHIGELSLASSTGEEFDYLNERHKNLKS